MKNTIIVIILSLLCGCGVKRYKPDPEENFKNAGEELILKKIEYGEHGLPDFSYLLGKRPNTEGESFSIVQYHEKRPIKSLDLVVINRENYPDGTLPIKIIFEWTGIGFRKGVEFGGKLSRKQKIKNNGSDWSTSDSVAALPFFASVAIGTAGGFFYGVFESTSALFEEFEKIVIRKKEVLTGYTLYEYDELDRLKLMKIYNPNNREEVIHVDFYYQDISKLPYKTEYSSKPEDLVRTIYSDPEFP